MKKWEDPRVVRVPTILCLVFPLGTHTRYWNRLSVCNWVRRLYLADLSQVYGSPGKHCPVFNPYNVNYK